MAKWKKATLSAANNWKHEWTNLEAGHNWQVVEKDVPDGYTGLVGKNGNIFTVTNTLTPSPPPPPDELDIPQTG